MTKAMILAAGRGERMRPLTDSCPKPLLKVMGKPLIVHHIEKLAALGIQDIVINHAWLGEQIEFALGDGIKWGVNIHYSPESEALESAGGLIQALPLLGDEPFMVVNGDIHCDFDFARLDGVLKGDEQVHLVLVNNPEHNPGGDFALTGQGKVLDAGNERLTFSGISVYHPKFFASHSKGRASVVPLLREAMAKGIVGGQHHDGNWTDVGTPQRLALLEQQLVSQQLMAGRE